MLVARVGEPVLKPAVAGQQQEPFAVVVETPDWINVRNRDEVAKRGARRLGIRRELRDDAVRLKKDEVPHCQ